MTVLLIDAASLYFRAFHGVPASVTAPDGMPVNAIRGYLDMTSTLLVRRRPTHYVACLDADWRPAFRVALLPSYKANRVGPDGGEVVPPELIAQVPVLLAVLTAVGLRAVGAPGFEADDVIASLAAHATEPVEVVSGDRDMFAVVRPGVRLLYVGRGVAKLEDCGPDEVLARYGIAAAQYPDFAVLRGDPSDGLPGISGIGEKSAAALVSRFGSVEAILAAAQAGAEGIPVGMRARLLAGADYLTAAAQVVRPRTDALGEAGDQDAVAALAGTALPSGPADPAALVDLVDRYGLESPVNRLLNALASLAHS